MKTLFAISIVALLALLWASFSIARHIRETRRKRKWALEEMHATAHRPPPPPIPYANPGGRAEWVQINKDSGDLSDPYQGQRRRPKDTSAR